MNYRRVERYLERELKKLEERSELGRPRGRSPDIIRTHPTAYGQPPTVTNKYSLGFTQCSEEHNFAVFSSPCIVNNDGITMGQHHSTRSSCGLHKSNKPKSESNVINQKNDVVSGVAEVDLLRLCLRAQALIIR